MVTTKLPDFEGREVRKATLRVTKAGDGLSEALSLEPVALHHGDRVHLVLEGVVTQVNHRPDGKVEDGEVDDLVRMHTVEAIDIAIVGEGDVADLLAANAKRVEEQRQERERELQRQREAEAGVMRIPGTDDDEADEAEVLTAQHNAGTHADGLRKGCPLCDAERDAEAAEAKEKK